MEHILSGGTTWVRPQIASSDSLKGTSAVWPQSGCHGRSKWMSQTRSGPHEFQCNPVVRIRQRGIRTLARRVVSSGQIVPLNGVHLGSESS